MPNVLFFTDDSPEVTALVLRQAPPTFEVNVQSSRLGEAEQERLLAETDFLILNSRMPNEQALRATHRLKLIQLMSAGYNHINFALCRELGIPVANNGGVNAIVDEVALLAALTERRIMGAALDVLEEEPPAPDNPILKLDNVLLSPQMAGNSHDTWLRRGQFAFDHIQRVWAGQPPQAVVSCA